MEESIGKLLLYASISKYFSTKPQQGSPKAERAPWTTHTLNIINTGLILCQAFWSCITLEYYWIPLNWNDMLV